MGIWQPDMLNIEEGVHSALLAKERVRLIDGWKHRETMGVRIFIWITLSLAEKPTVANSGGQVLKRSLVDHTPCAVQRYSASMDHRKACGRCDHERRANPAGEVRSVGVDCRCEELSDERIARC